MQAKTLAALTLLVPGALAQGPTPLDIPPYVQTELSAIIPSFAYTAGFFFQAPLPFRITGARVPDELGDGSQSLEIILSSTRPPLAAAAPVGRSVFAALLQPSSQVLQVGVTVQAGEWVCVLGACGASPLLNSVGEDGPFPSDVFGMPVELNRLEAPVDITANTGAVPISEGIVGTGVGRIELYLDPVAGAAAAIPFGTGCGGDGPVNVYESFEFITAPPDLTSGQGFTLSLGSPSYTITATSSGYDGPGSAVTLGDDEIRRVPLPNPMPTAFGSTTDIWVSANGFVALQQPPTTNPPAAAPDVDALLNEPFARVCPFWADLDPTLGGFVFIDTVGPIVRVTWADVPTKSTPTQLFTNTFQCSFDTLSGDIEFDYRRIAPADALVGYSPGSGALPGGRVDLSQLTRLELGTGVPDLGLSSGARPVLGSTATLQLDGVSSTAPLAVFLLGLNRASVALDPIGMPGCTLYLSSVGSVAAQPSGGVATLSLPIPATAMAGASVFVQAAAVASGANPLGLASSNGVEWVLGSL